MSFGQGIDFRQIESETKGILILEFNKPLIKTICECFIESYSDDRDDEEKYKKELELCRQILKKN